MFRRAPFVVIALGGMSAPEAPQIQTDPAVPQGEAAPGPAPHPSGAGSSSDRCGMEGTGAPPDVEFCVGDSGLWGSSSRSPQLASLRLPNFTGMAKSTCCGARCDQLPQMAAKAGIYASDAKAQKAACDLAVARTSKAAKDAQAKDAQFKALAAAAEKVKAATIGEGGNGLNKVSEVITGPNVDKDVKGNGDALIKAVEKELEYRKEEKSILKGKMGSLDDAWVVARGEQLRLAVNEARATQAAVKARIVEYAALAEQEAWATRVCVAVCLHVNRQGRVVVGLREAGVHMAVDEAKLRRLENIDATNKARSPEEWEAEARRHWAAPYELPKGGVEPPSHFRDGTCKGATLLGFEPLGRDAEGDEVRFVPEGVLLEGKVQYRQLLLNMFHMPLPAADRIPDFDREGFHKYVMERIGKPDVALSFAEIDFFDYCAVMWGWDKFPPNLAPIHEWPFNPPVDRETGQAIPFRLPYPIPEPDDPRDDAKRQRVMA